MPGQARGAARSTTTPAATPAKATPAKAATAAAAGTATPSPEERLRALRAPFAPAQIGKLPRITCQACSKAAKEHRGTCDNPRHAKARCEGCRNWISQAHIHLDYVGHAAVTNRLLDADPDWTWEPFAVDANGLPMLDRNGGLWIKLTVLGRTRIGYGDVTGTGGVKELIGDALRNAAMRFGVALDLWSKEDLSSLSNDSQETQPGPAENRPEPSDPSGAGNDRPASTRNWVEEARRLTTEQEVIDLGRAAHEAGEFTGAVKAFLVSRRQEVAAAARTPNGNG